MTVRTDVLNCASVREFSRTMPSESVLPPLETIAIVDMIYLNLIVEIWLHSLFSLNINIHDCNSNLCVLCLILMERFRLGCFDSTFFLMDPSNARSQYCSMCFLVYHLEIRFVKFAMGLKRL